MAFLAGSLRRPAHQDVLVQLKSEVASCLHGSAVQSLQAGDTTFMRAERLHKLTL